MKKQDELGDVPKTEPALSAASPRAETRSGLSASIAIALAHDPLGDGRNVIEVLKHIAKDMRDASETMRTNPEAKKVFARFSAMVHEIHLTGVEVGVIAAWLEACSKTDQP